jgi:hypothetical protein
MLPARLWLWLAPPFCCAASILAAAAADAPAPAPAPAQTTIVDLQPYRLSDTIAITDGAAQAGTATLINLNPTINAWYLLKLDWHDRVQPEYYHLENPDRHGQNLALGPDGLQLVSGTDTRNCELWPKHAIALTLAQHTGLPYTPLCGGHLYLRNHVNGSQTQIEKVTDFLRDHVWGGDKIVTFVRSEFYQDAFMEKAQRAAAAVGTEPAGAPPVAQMAVHADHNALFASDLGIALATRSLRPGHWYAVPDAPGIYLSTIQPKAVDPEIARQDQGKVPELDEVEESAVEYLVAFDLGQHDLGYVLGTDHPRIGWSERVLDSMHDPKLAGPDGINTPAPLVTTGMLSPALLPRVAATFTGGFKREHGAFRYGPMAMMNHGTHYGFIENGVVFSHIQPGLSTLFMLNDGTIGMRTWTQRDNVLLPRVVNARQNGVPLIEFDEDRAVSSPGSLVGSWGEGNWSGSADEKQRTLRAGACLRDAGDQHFLIYGYFSTATPAAMVRVFQAYGCRYAMHLDMNALEHTYLALYTRKNGELVMQHLINGMGAVDGKDAKEGGQPAPRFLSYADDRDFFYLLRKEAPK